MAKRKRLSLTEDAGPDQPQIPVGNAGINNAGARAAIAFGPSAPIARVAGDASATAALQDLADEVARARAEGRLLQALPLEEVDEGWMVRDRLGVDPEDLASLIDSLRSHGQRTAIEVVDRGERARPRYGLISGWRRLAALRHLHAETQEPRFATVLAVLRRPETAGDAYVAMVEENEIRAGLSYYERARIAALAVGAGVFPTSKVALQRLYASASRSRRSKIGSFLVLHTALDSALRWPEAISERMGLALAKRIETDPAYVASLTRMLQANSPADASAEQAVLARSLKGVGPQKESKSAKKTLSAPKPGIQIHFDGIAPQAEIRLTGPGVNSALQARLEALLRGI